jgi:restriction endonuclease Mrr
MSIPDYQSLMLPVLIASEGGEVRIRDVVERLANELKLTPDERAELLLSGKQGLFANRVHWAKTYLAKGGLVEATQRGSIDAVVLPKIGKDPLQALQPSPTSQASACSRDASQDTQSARELLNRPLNIGNC